jgi:hypothetical protein
MLDNDGVWDRERESRGRKVPNAEKHKESFAE